MIYHYSGYSGGSSAGYSGGLTGYLYFSIIVGFSNYNLKYFTI